MLSAPRAYHQGWNSARPLQVDGHQGSPMRTRGPPVHIELDIRGGREYSRGIRSHRNAKEAASRVAPLLELLTHRNIFTRSGHIHHRTRPLDRNGRASVNRTHTF